MTTVSADEESDQSARVAGSGDLAAEPPAKRRRLFRLRKPTGSRTPQGSAFYGRVLPILIVIMAIVTVALILFAVGVLVGLVPFR